MSFWVRFDYGEGKFLEKEFSKSTDFYEHLELLELNHTPIEDWNYVDPLHSS
jgi:hypothetical protein